MKQDYDQYREEDFKVWKTLFERQLANLQDKSCREYLDCLTELYPVLNADAIPRFEDLSAALKQKTGWSVHVVPGLIPPQDFFELLAQKKFCSSTWLRRMDQLDYLEEPDMFHDIFGHIPLFMDQDYADFAQQIGKVGVQYIDDEEVVTKLQRLYWFTIEFGVLKTNVGKIYGAGIISSFGESNAIFEGTADFIPFDLEELMNTDFRTDVIQTKYFELESLPQLYKAFDEYASKMLSRKVVV